MQRTHRIIIMALTLIMSLATSMQVQAHRDAPNVGGKLGYVGKNHGIEIGAFFEYPLGHVMRISPELGCVVRNNNLSGFKADFNLHFPLNMLDSENIQLYPIAGVNYAFWHNFAYKIGEHKEASSTDSRIGINLGAGFEIFASSRFKIKIEWKYTIASGYSTVVLDAGLGYFF